jgi:orotate phosphoribosyltransferase
MVQSERMHGLMREVDEAGFLSEGHFAFRSGRHALKLLDRDQLLVDTQLASKMGYAIAKHFFLSRIDIVAAPSVWGAGLAQWVGYFLDPRRPVIYPTPSNGHYTFNESSKTMIDGKRVLVIDNLILSGKTAQELVQTITANGGTPIAVGALADLSGIDFPITVFGLLNDYLEIHGPETCPACAAGMPVTEVGY